MKKRIISAAARHDAQAQDEGWLPLDGVAEVEITSESPAHPIEAALAPGGAGWKAEAPGEQAVRLKFDPPLALRRVRIVIEEDKHERTQQFVLRASMNGQWHELIRQQFNFSPLGATREQEEYRVELSSVAALELTIIPDLASGDARASLRELRLA
jgi:hypothetical protein